MRRVQAPRARAAALAGAQCRHRGASGRAVLAHAASAVATRENKGDERWTKSYYPKLADTKQDEKDWFIIDASGQTLGRLATLAATVIRGKHLPTYTPSMDMGSRVIVVNCEKVRVTGKKPSQKKYYRHSGRPGSLKVETFTQLQRRIPERIIEHAVHGMLPKGRLGHRIRLHLQVYKGPDHPHEAQKPVDITHMINQKVCIPPKLASSAEAIEAAKSI